MKVSSGSIATGIVFFLLMGGFFLFSRSKHEPLSNFTAPIKIQIDDSPREIRFKVETKSGASLSGVYVVGLSSMKVAGVTDSTGSVDITGKERIVLWKDGFEPLELKIKWKESESSDVIRTVILRAKTLFRDTSILVPTGLTTGESKTECKGTYDDNKFDNSDVISVAKHLEKTHSSFYISAYSWEEIHCKIFGNPGELSLAYALPDDSSISRVDIKVYINGNLRKTLSLDSGKSLREKVDLTGASSYTLVFLGTSRDSSQSGFVYRLGSSPPWLADYIVVSCLAALGDTEHIINQNWDGAEYLYSQSLRISRELHDPYAVAILTSRLGENELGRGNLDAAETLLQDALAQMQQLGMTNSIAETNWDLAQLYRAKNNPDLAHQHYTTAHQLFTQLGAAKDLEKIEQDWNNANS
jgi:hypothetical protein